MPAVIVFSFTEKIDSYGVKHSGMGYYTKLPEIQNQNIFKIPVTEKTILSLNFKPEL